MSKASGSNGRRRARLVASWRQSGESQARFARRHGVHPRTFWGWCQADDQDAAATVGPSTFLPVRVVDAPASVPAGEIEIVLTSGDRVYLRGDSPSALLAQAVTVLRRAC